MTLKLPYAAVFRAAVAHITYLGAYEVVSRSREIMHAIVKEFSLGRASGSAIQSLCGLCGKNMHESVTPVCM